MASILQELTDILCDKAGWAHKNAEKDCDAEGALHFELEGDLSFEILSPNRKMLVLRGVMCATPAGDSEKDELCKRIAKLNVASMTKRRSVPALHEGKIELQRSLSLDNIHASMLETQFLQAVKEFLNDLAWWQKQCSSQGANAAPASAFSFGGNQWFSNL